MRVKSGAITVLAVALGLVIGARVATQGQPRAMRKAAALGDFRKNASLVLTPAAVRRALLPPEPETWKPGTNKEKPRGGIEVYSAAGPAVVVVRTNEGHGSGFLIRPDGVLVTNHHVIESGLSNTPTASYAMVHVGQLGTDGVMQLRGEPVRAWLYKIDTLNDLAMLKLDRPATAPPLAVLKLSTTPPRPGQDCSILGHPSSGMLWTFRPCQVASVGDWPKDMVNLVMPRLAATGAQRANIEAQLKDEPARRIMITSAQANPGDSGGPVLDKDGALIGVTFAGPGDAREDKFTYHIHLDEVRKFIAQIPSAPTLLVPDPWNLGPRVTIKDLDGDGKPDVLVAGTNDPEVLLFDLDNDTPKALLSGDASMSALVRDHKWDFEAGIDLRGSGYIAYYDSDNDGRPDLVLVTDEDSMAAKGAFTLGPGGVWRYAPATGQRILAESHLKDPQLARRLGALLRALGM